MREGKCLLGMGNPAAETVVCLHMERRWLCQRSKMPNARFSKLCLLRDGLLYFRMMTVLFLRPVCVPLFAWALVREIDKKTAHTQVTGLHIDDEGQIRESCWSDGFLRYERIEITERPQSSGK